MSAQVERYITILSEVLVDRGINTNSLGIQTLFEDLRGTSVNSSLGQLLSSTIQQNAYIEGKSLLLYAGGTSVLDEARDIASKTSSYIAESTDMAKAFGGTSSAPGGFIGQLA